MQKKKPGSAPKGLHTQRSQFDVATTLNRAIVFLQEKNVRIFAHISHSDAARDVGLQLQPEELLIFGSPKVGTDLMVENPAIGIELPLKLIIWQEGDDTVVGWQNLQKLTEDYGLEKTINVIQGMEQFLKNLVNSITSEQEHKND